MAEDTPNKGGRPTKYKEEYNEQVYNYALLGVTDEQLATFFNVCVATINNWKKNEPEFLESIKKGKEDADAQVVKSLFKRANGYTIKETRVSSGGENECISTTEKEIPADTTAAIFWLKNRQKEHWRDKQEIEKKSEVEITDNSALKGLSTEKLEKIYNIMEED